MAAIDAKAAPAAPNLLQQLGLGNTATATAAGAGKTFNVDANRNLASGMAAAQANPDMKALFEELAKADKADKVNAALKGKGITGVDEKTIADLVKTTDADTVRNKLSKFLPAAGLAAAAAGAAAQNPKNTAVPAIDNYFAGLKCEVSPKRTLVEQTALREAFNKAAKTKLHTDEQVRINMDGTASTVVLAGTKHSVIIPAAASLYGGPADTSPNSRLRVERLGRSGDYYLSVSSGLAGQNISDNILVPAHLARHTQIQFVQADGTLKTVGLADIPKAGDVSDIAAAQAIESIPLDLSQRFLDLSAFVEEQKKRPETATVTLEQAQLGFMANLSKFETQLNPLSVGAHALGESIILESSKFPTGKSCRLDLSKLDMKAAITALNDKLSEPLKEPLLKNLNDALARGEKSLVVALGRTEQMVAAPVTFTVLEDINIIGSTAASSHRIPKGTILSKAQASQLQQIAKGEIEAKEKLKVEANLEKALEAVNHYTIINTNPATKTQSATMFEIAAKDRVQVLAAAAKDSKIFTSTVVGAEAPADAASNPATQLAIKMNVSAVSSASLDSSLTSPVLETAKTKLPEAELQKFLASFAATTSANGSGAAKVTVVDKQQQPNGNTQTATASKGNWFTNLFRSKS
jgi:hypothetical protein